MMNTPERMYPRKTVAGVGQPWRLLQEGNPTWRDPYLRGKKALSEADEASRVGRHLDAARLYGEAETAGLEALTYVSRVFDETLLAHVSHSLLVTNDRAVDDGLRSSTMAQVMEGIGDLLDVRRDRVLEVLSLFVEASSKGASVARLLPDDEAA